MIPRDKAFDIVDSHIQNKNLVKHCLAVEAAMRELAKQFNDDENIWGIVGLVHDADWEETKDDVRNHTEKTVHWLKEAGENDEELFHAVRAHNVDSNGVEPQSPMEWALYCCDELTGLITATALMTPDKKIGDVTVKSVKKKFKNKKFAAAVNREQIALCEEKLNIPLDTFIEIVLKSMQKNADDLGL